MMVVNLVLFKKDGSQKSFSLPSNITIVGRRHDCDLCIPLMRISRRHCQLNQNKDTLKIRDLGSRNGTYLNDEKIDGEILVQAGDYLRVGHLTFQIQIDGEPKEIVPPETADHIPTQLLEPMPEPAADGDEFPEFELDESDSFLDELEELE